MKGKFPAEGTTVAIGNCIGLMGGVGKDRKVVSGCDNFTIAVFASRDVCHFDKLFRKPDGVVPIRRAGPLHITALLGKVIPVHLDAVVIASNVNVYTEDGSTDQIWRYSTDGRLYPESNPTKCLDRFTVGLPVFYYRIFNISCQWFLRS